MTTYADLFGDGGAQLRADLLNSDRVSNASWFKLASDAILYAWNIAASARPDFQIASNDQTIISGVSASLSLTPPLGPSDFHALIDVVCNPDTTGEYSLGPFAWANRRSPGGWNPAVFGFQGTPGGSAVRLMGNLIYVEPSTRAGGPYRIWYCPKPNTPKWQVKFATFGSAQLSSAIFATPGGPTPPGPGDTLTSATPGDTLIVDAGTPAVGDRVLISGLTHNGQYTMTQAGVAPSTPWILTRANDYSVIGNVALGDRVYVTDGAQFANSVFTQTTASPASFATVAFSFGAAAIDSILEPWVELIKLKIAIPAIQRDDDLDANTLKADMAKLETQMTAYFRSIRNSNGAQKMTDTDARGPFSVGRGWW